MMFKPIIKFIPYLGILILIAFVLSAWFPTNCSYLNQAIGACSTKPTQNVKISTGIITETDELNRIPHQTITSSLIDFSVKAQDYRAVTKINFNIKGDIKDKTIWLNVKNKDQWQKIALINTPGLIYEGQTPEQVRGDNNVSASASEAVSPTTSPLDDFPTKFKENYKPMFKDFTWYFYQNQFDFSEIPVQANNQLQFSLDITPFDINKDKIYLSEVHVNYQTMNP